MAANVHEMPKGKAFASEALSVDHATTQDVLTASTYAPSGRHAHAAFLQVTVDAIIYSIDGTDPNTRGIAAANGDVIILNNIDQIINFQAVKVTNTATVTATYFRGK